ncbi:MAG TPA: nuclear transport factor 2 family protein [Casimicrobiaceae bacterium]|nr:nuclear transport factor 2 family protein [Casimicrobiaceae bacterium]
MIILVAMSHFLTGNDPLMNALPAASISLSLLLAGCATVPPDAAVKSLIAAENAFAAMGAAKGVRASFLANFADDGLLFTPAPVRLRETWSARPLPADPLAQQLQWQPAAAAVARSGELGFTTGPFASSPADGSRPPSYGIFTSVWRRDAGGRWQVMIDVGVGTPAPVTVEQLAPAPTLFAAADSSTPSPSTIEKEMRGAASGAFAAALATDARWYRDDRMPVLRRDEFTALLAETAPALEITPDSEVTSGSQDFAYTYGTLRTNVNEPARNYVHLWKRDAASHWRIAVAVWP